MDSSIKIGSAWILIFSCLIGLVLIVLCVSLARYRHAVLLLRKEMDAKAVDYEQQVEKAKAAAQAKGDFLSRMSHEIRTPLNAILGMAQIAKNTSEKSKVKDCMDKLEDSSKHLLGVINDILDFSKIESGNFALDAKLFSLIRDIDFVVSMLKTKIADKNLNFSADVGGIQHDGVVGDMLRLNQVLINLLSNAIKFTDSGGTIELIVEELLHVGGESVYRFTVRDTGVGIDQEQAKKLFTPFMQANAGVARVYGGTGLGLAISQNIVRMMGGDIELETQPGIGSAFMFTIRTPAQESFTEFEERNVALAPPAKLHGKRILIVDDIEINREVVEALLDGSGAIMDVAVNGKEALDAFLTAGPYWYDLILMDMQMPVMDGCAATMEIRDSGKRDAQDIKIVAMTANVLPEDVQRARKAGMNGYLAKPIDLAELYAGMEEWL